MRHSIAIILMLISVVSFGQGSGLSDGNFNHCLETRNISNFKSFDNQYQILSEICKLYNIELIDSSSWLGGLFKLKKDLFLPKDDYSFEIVLVPIYDQSGCIRNYDRSRLSQIKIITKSDSTLFSCEAYKPAYLLQSVVEVLPEKPHEFGEFFTTSTYMVIDYETLYIIAKGEISDQGDIYFKNNDELKMKEFEYSKQQIEKYR